MPLLPTLCACENVVYKTFVNFASNVWKTQKAFIMHESIASV